MGRTPEFEHDVVGDIDQHRDTPLPDCFKPPLNKRGRVDAGINPFDYPAREPAT